MKMLFQPNISRFVPALSRKRFLSNQFEPVIIMGRGHSGTRILTWICESLGVQLGAHADRHTGDVNDLKFSRRIKKIAIGNIKRPVPQGTYRSSVRRFQRAVRGYYERLGRPSQPWGWKFPETYLITPIVAETFPRARYIHLVRDGRDVAFKKHLTDDPTRKLGRTILSHLGLLKEPCHIQAAVSWAFQVDRFDEDKKELPAGQILEMRFEKLCREPNAETLRLCEFLGLPMNEQTSEYLSSQIQPGKVSQHRHNEREKVEEVEDRIKPTLTRYGYMS